MSTITWAVDADLDFSTSYETALTGYIERPGSGIKILREIGPDGAYRTSKVDIVLSNRGGEFTPENTASAFHGLSSRPGIPIRVKATLSAVDYTLWTGYIQRWKTTWEGSRGVSLCALTCYDLWYYLTDGEPIDVAASVSRDTDGALTAIATSLGLAGGDYSFADGVQDLPAHWSVGQNGAAAMQDVADSEMFGWLYVDALGVLKFEARSSRLGTSVDDTWGDSTSLYPVRVAYDLDPLEYITSVRVRGVRFAIGDADVEVDRWTVGVGNGLFLASGTVYERTFQADSATVSVSAPTAVTHYSANASDDGSGADRTSSLAPSLTDLGGGRYTLKLTASADLYVHKMIIPGQPVEVYPDRPEIVVSKAWTGEKAGQNIDIDVPWADGDSTKLRDYAVQSLRIGRYSPARVQLDFVAGSDALKVALLSVELGDLIKYKDTAVGADKSAYLDDWWYVNRIAIDIPPDLAGQSFFASIGLERSYDHRNLDAIVYDSFDRSNATGDLGTATSGAVWADDAGFNIASSAARANTDTLSMANLNLGASITDQVIEVSLAAIGTGDEVGVVFRYADANNQYRAYVDKGSNEVILEKNVAGVVTEISSPAYTVGTTAEIRVINQGTRIRVWVDRKLYIDTTDSGLSAGTKVGLFARNASGTTTVEDFYGQGI